MNEGETFGTATGGAMPPQNGNSFDRPTGAISSGATGVAGAAGIGVTGATASTIAGAANGTAMPMSNMALSAGVASTADAGAEAGNIPTISTAGVSNSSRFFGGRSRFSRHDAANTVSSQQANYAAAQNIAANPNTPQFFSDAVVASTPVPPAPKRKSKKGLFIGIGAVVVVAVVAVVAGVIVVESDKITNGRSGNLSETVKEYLSDIYGEYEGSYSDFSNISEGNYPDYELVEKIESRSNADSDAAYEDMINHLDDMLIEVDSSEMSEEHKNTMKTTINSDKRALVLYYFIASSMYSEKTTSYKSSDINNQVNKLKENEANFGDDETGRSVYLNLLEFLEEKYKKAEIYSKYGCLDTGSPNLDCVESIPYSSFLDVEHDEGRAKYLENKKNDNRRILFVDAQLIFSLLSEESLL